MKTDKPKELSDISEVQWNSSETQKLGGVTLLPYGTLGGGRSTGPSVVLGPMRKPSSKRSIESGLEVPSPLYVCRPVENAEEIVDWARGQGFIDVIDSKDIHVTTVYSRNTVQPTTPNIEPIEGHIVSARPVRIDNALALPIESSHLLADHNRYREAGASHDYDVSYRPHVTIKYDPSEADLDRSKTVEPFTGRVVLGPEIQAPLKQGWRPKPHQDG